jgi:REP element-mobilizing transposase RayT
MARLARGEVFAADEIAIVHVMNRTVRRCFLLGNDAVTGRNYDHRKLWIDEQLVHQAKYFGIDLLCQAIMSNHIHLILRSRPDVVQQWTDAEVARRWLMLCPERRDEKRRPLEPTEFEINNIVNSKERLVTVRSRLSDISWWMRLLSQNIAQRANKEDAEVGKFWQARYRAVRLLDETAILACAAYVDLNPIRAARAQTIEASDFTSAQKRLSALSSRLSDRDGRGAARPEVSKGKNGEHLAAAEAVPVANRRESETGGKDSRPEERSGYVCRHLAPVELKERNGKPGPDPNLQGTRCSNKGFLPMSTAEYLTLLDWTACQIRSDKTGATPKQFTSLFERLGISAEAWKELVGNFGRLFSMVAGKPTTVDSHNSRSGSHRYRTRVAARELLATA